MVGKKKKKKKKKMCEEETNRQPHYASQRQRQQSEGTDDITGDGKIDLISKLPDKALSSIISFLPSTQEAVATSVISKRWRFLWKSLSRLSLDLPLCASEFRPLYLILPTKQVCIVDNFLSSLTDNIEFFHLIHLPQDWKHYNKFMPRWVELLKNEKSLQRISLSCDVKNSSESTVIKKWILYDKFIVLPRGIFNGRFLQVVELNRYVLRDASSFEGCVNVKTLKFTSCVVNEEVLIGVLSNCEFLENLSLHACNWLSESFPDNVSIRHQKLKLLEIHQMSVWKFDLFCESLTKLVLQNLLYLSKVTHIDCPKLQVLKTNNPEMLDQLQGTAPLFK